MDVPPCKVSDLSSAANQIIQPCDVDERVKKHQVVEISYQECGSNISSIQ